MSWYCPICGAPEKTRERRPRGNSFCEAGHSYSSFAALDEPQKLYTELSDVPSKWNGHARLTGASWVVGKEPSEDFKAISQGLGEAVVMAGAGVTSLFLSVPEHYGAVAIAVDSHLTAEVLNDVFRRLGNPQHEGVRVIPFAASALAYCGPGARLFSALIVVPPRSAIPAAQFESWVAQAIVPYLAPNAPRINL